MNQAATTTEKLTLCELLQAVAALSKEELTLENYSSLIQRLDLPQGLIDEHIHFTDESYARNLICVCPRFEMILMCWKKGQVSSIHDHMRSFAILNVVQGTLTNRNYRVNKENPSDDDCPLELVNEELIPAGQWVNLGRDAIHQMGNLSDEPLITLHYYARPLREIHYYHPEENRRELVRLVYSLLHF